MTISVVYYLCSIALHLRAPRAERVATIDVPLALSSLGTVCRRNQVNLERAYARNSLEIVLSQVRALICGQT
jgi:hypothetical protein